MLATMSAAPTLDRPAASKMFSSSGNTHWLMLLTLHGAYTCWFALYIVSTSRKLQCLWGEALVHIVALHLLKRKVVCCLCSGILWVSSADGHETYTMRYSIG